ncbi:hypothetical protein DICPUDRAFT_40671, partial [Dictyostelium purpureum]
LGKMSMIKAVVYSSFIFNFLLIIGSNSKKKQGSACPFCCYPTENIIFQNDNIKVFNDRTPKATVHYLVCPKIHIESIKTLEPSDLPVLIEMKNVANQIVAEKFPNQKYRLGFHVPPFYSVKHLHLHLLVEPFYKFKKSKYTPYFGGLWYKDIDTVINELHDKAV